MSGRYDPLSGYESEDPYGEKRGKSAGHGGYGDHGGYEESSDDEGSVVEVPSWRGPVNAVFIQRLRLLMIVSLISGLFATLLTVQFMISITQLEVFYQADNFYGRVHVEALDSGYHHLGNSTCEGYKECTEVICRYSTLSPPLEGIPGNPVDSNTRSSRVFTSIDFGPQPPDCSALELTGYFSISEYRSSFVIATAALGAHILIPFLLAILGYLKIRYQIWTRLFLFSILAAKATLGASFCLIITQSYEREQQDSILVGQLVSLMFLLLDTSCTLLLGILAL